MRLLDAIRSVFLSVTGTASEVQRQEALNDIADMRCERIDRYDLYEGYYDGDRGHAKLTGRLKAWLEANGVAYVENFCEPVVDSLAMRLQLNGVTSGDKALDEWIVALWKANRVDDTQGIVHTQTPMKGDGFILVDWSPDTGLSRFTWNAPHLIRPVYDEHGTMLMAAKVWSESRRAVTNPNGRPIRRMNLYFPDRVEKWFTLAATAGEGQASAIWAPHVDYRDEENGSQGVVPWVDAAGVPLGIPIFHFRNKPKGRDFGRSELHSVIPQQNFLTKQLVDLAETLDYQGAAQRWATGIGDAAFESAPGTVWKTKDKDARFGQFEPADPKGISDAIKDTLTRVAARSQTPLHQLMSGGNNPTGETLRAANAPLTAKAVDRQTSYGGPWVDAHMMAAKLQALHDPSFNLPDDLTLECAWESAETADPEGEVTRAEALHRLGVSKKTLLTELGYDADKEATQRAEEAKAGAEAIGRAFNRGDTEDEPPEPLA